MSEQTLIDSTASDKRPTRHLARIDVPETDAYLEALDVERISLRRACEALGIDYPTQWEKLKTRSWATVGQSLMVAQDGKIREMVIINHRTFTMWLATIDENAVNKESRDLIIAFQCRAADAIHNHFRAETMVSGQIVLELEEKLCQTERERDTAVATSEAFEANGHALILGNTEKRRYDERKDVAFANLVQWGCNISLTRKQSEKLIQIEKEYNSYDVVTRGGQSRREEKFMELVLRKTKEESHGGSKKVTPKMIRDSLPADIRPELSRIVEKMVKDGSFEILASGQEPPKSVTG